MNIFNLSSFSFKYEKFQEKIADFFNKFEQSFPILAKYLYIISYAVFLSFGSFFIKMLSEIPIFQSIYITAFLSLCLCFFTHPNNLIPKERKTYLRLLQRGALGVGGIILYFKSLAFLPLSLASLFLLMSPLWLVIIERVFYKESYGIIHFSLTLFSFIGLILIIQPEFLFGDREVIKGYNKVEFFLGIVCGISTSIVNINCNVVLPLAI